MKKRISTVLLLAVVACASEPIPEEIPVTAIPAAPHSVFDQCVADFKSATQRLVILAQQSPEHFPKGFGDKVESLSVKVSVACDYQGSGYGFEVFKEENKISLENRIPSLAKLFISDPGKNGFAKFKLKDRSIPYDRQLVALAAQAYAELLGVAEANYQTFFSALKSMEY